MTVISKFFTSMVTVLFYTISLWAQPQTDAELIPEQVLTNILQKIKKAPIIHEECILEDCQKIAKYSNGLYNLQKDVWAYSTFLEENKANYFSLWENYVQQNVANVDLKRQLEWNLAKMEFSSDLGNYILDLVTLQKAIESGGEVSLSTIINLCKRLLATSARAYESMEKFGKAMTDLQDKTSLPEPLKTIVNSWKFISTSISNGTTVLRETIKIYESIKDNQGLDAKELLSKRKASGANILAAIAQVLSLVAKYEIDDMKQAIHKVDEAITANENIKSQAYEKYVTRAGLLDILVDIRKELALRTPYISVLHYRCTGKSLVRFPREEIPFSTGSFGKGLLYYKQILIESVSNLSTYWAGIEECNMLRDYEFAIHDGAGKRYDATIKISRNSDGRSQEGVTYRRTGVNHRKFTLAPGEYTINILHSERSDEIRVAGAIISNFKVTGNEPKVITLSPFGRAVIIVESESDYSQLFNYIFKDANNEKITRASAYDKVTVDLPLETDMSLSVGLGLNSIEDKNLKVSPYHVLTLKYYYKDYSFTSINTYDLNGIWETVDYDCNNNKTVARAKINHRGTYITAKKTTPSEEFCLPKGYSWFEGELKSRTGKLKWHTTSLGDYNRETNTFKKATKLVLGSFQSDYEIISQNEFKIGGIIYRRVE